ncbi:MAG: hypothetical protein PF483_03335 [Halothiobacillus sp.]|jgi:hypothetical protein|nr:hypothetical protein [Halothiobacillus sp.]
MCRPLRIEVEAVLHQVMARGNARADNLLCDENRQAFIDNLRHAVMGTEAFIETLLDKFDNGSDSTEVPKQLRPARSLERISRG